MAFTLIVRYKKLWPILNKLKNISPVFPLKKFYSFRFLLNLFQIDVSVCYSGEAHHITVPVDIHVLDPQSELIYMCAFFYAGATRF